MTYLGDRPREHGAHGAIDVAYGHFYGDLFTALERRACQLDQAMVERFVKPMVLIFNAIACHLRTHLGLMKDPTEI